MGAGLWFVFTSYAPSGKMAQDAPAEPNFSGKTTADSMGLSEQVPSPTRDASLAAAGQGLDKPLLDEDTKARQNAGQDLRAGRPFTIMEHGQLGRYRLALDEIYDATAPTHARLRKIPEQADAAQLLSYAETESQRLGRWPGLVIYPEKGPSDEKTRRVLTEQVLLKAEDVSQAEKLAAAHGLKVTNRPGYAPKHLITAAASPMAAVDAISNLGANGLIQSVEPLLMRQGAQKAVLNDPILADQWHLKNTGQLGGKPGVDINVEDVWDTYQGQGVRVAVVDDGLEISHPDLSSNVDTANHYDWNDSPADTDPSPDPIYDFHGTAVSGLIGACGNNNLGVSGVAPQTTLVGFRLIAGLLTDETAADSAIRGADVIQVKNNSWGVPDGYPYELGTVSTLMEEAMAAAAASGRGGLGTISVWAAGNGRHQGDQGNKDGYANSMYGLAVGATTDKGKLTFYSETGSHICVVAPSAERKGGIVTTDLEGVAGYNYGSLKNLSEVDYTNDFNGTSAAAPIVSGVVALMLQANPSLNWRDVKEILLRSSTQIDPKSKGWVERNPGDAWEADLPPIKHHESYGGGLINASAAVAMAEGWTSLGPMISESLSQTPPTTTSSLTRNVAKGGTTIIVLPEETQKTKIKSTRLEVDFSNSTAMRVEHVTVKVNASHSRRGDLTIRLISPSGTVSTLASYTRKDTGANYSNWTFTSVRHWGESSRGVWAVVASEPIDDVDGSLGSVTITLHGTSYPAIQLTDAPEVQLVPEGTTATFSGATTQFGKTTQQWLKNDKPISGATTGTLSFSPAQLSDAGYYNYTAHNLTNDIDVPTALGVVRTAIPAQQVLPGRTAIFKITAAGPLLRYQWFVGSQPLRDDGRITGSRSPTLTLRKVSSADSEDYYCRVSLGNVDLNTQRGTLTIMIPPSLDEQEPPETGIVSAPLDFSFVAENGATHYTAKGLPPGIKLDAKTGLLSGRATKPGLYEVTIIASNPAGSSSPYTFIWEIEELPENTVGTYRGLVERNDSYNDGFGGAFTLSITRTGTFSGTLTRGKAQHRFKGALDTYAGESFSTANIRLPLPKPEEPLDLTFSLENGSLEGSLGRDEDEEDGAIVEAQRQWTSLPESFQSMPGLYNVPLLTSAESSAFPQGSGYLSTSLNAKGQLRYVGSLADGTRITGSAMLGEDGSLALHHMLYANTGSAQGTLSVVNDLPGVTAALDWFKSTQPEKSTTRSYRAGFPAHELNGVGLRYTAPTSGALLLDLPPTSFNARLDFSDGGLFIPFSQYFTLAAKNLAQFPTGSDNPHQLKFTVNAKTGLLTGKGKAMDIDPENPPLNRQRPGSFSGLVIPGLDRAEGYFLLPESTSPTAPIYSGHLILRSSAVVD